MTLDKRERENRYCLLLLSAYQLTRVQNNFLSTAQFSLIDFEKEEREREQIFFAFIIGVPINSGKKIISCVLRNSSVILIVIGMCLVKQQIIEQMMKLKIIYFN